MRLTSWVTIVFPPDRVQPARESQHDSERGQHCLPLSTVVTLYSRSVAKSSGLPAMGITHLLGGSLTPTPRVPHGSPPCCPSPWRALTDLLARRLQMPKSPAGLLPRRGEQIRGPS